MIDDAGAQYLAEALRNNKTLTTLNLWGNEIKDAGAQHLADALRNNTTLTTLDLVDNQIGDAGAEHLADALANNEVIVIPLSFVSYSSSSIHIDGRDIERLLHE
ncbi:unnamed protein product [Rotaria sordida]|uniref:Uncharacterized protein n=1 Tax=Rotaria sordida TaxID=392033 RepID=A0A814R6Z9_9BILA|nr:unnamed protein product [Rotaria sordida]